MTTLYRPVLIESAEQAEALPEGAVALAQIGPAPTKGSHGYWQDPIGGGLRDAAWAVGLMVLVPIEAEEETGVDDDADTFTPTRRLVTPWEEAQ